MELIVVGKHSALCGRSGNEERLKQNGVFVETIQLKSEHLKRLFFASRGALM